MSIEPNTLVFGDDIPHDILRKMSPYGYIPTTWICYTFVVLFGISTVLHIGQALWHKTHWLLITATLCGVGESIAWAGRLWGHYNFLNDTAFMMQECAAIISPTPLLAVNFILLGRIIQLLGPQYGLLSPKYYSIVFISADVIALVIQGAGGGIASSDDDPTRGGHIMLAGIAFQFAIMVIYCALEGDFFWRWKYDLPYRAATGPSSPAESKSDPNDELPASDGAMVGAKLLFLICALAFSTLCLFIRAIYRLIELSDGWSGDVMNTEKWFDIFDGAMVLLAIYTINIAHPGIFLPLRSPRAVSKA